MNMQERIRPCVDWACLDMDCTLLDRLDDQFWLDYGNGGY